MKAVHDHLIIKPSRIHGLGLFAVCDLPSGREVIEYRGEKIDKQESLRRCQQGNEFIFCLNDQCDLDGSVEWNLARYINHSCAPNCEAQNQGEHIWIVTNQAVSAGDEITFNYGYDLEDYRRYPCHCGSPACVGFMVAQEFFHLPEFCCEAPF